MQIGSVTRDVTSGGLGETAQATMVLNAKAVRILSDGLYSQKKLAVLRELSCNALDSHIAAGIPERPIKVHLPTTFEPWLAIQDFGIGLSHENIMSLYMSYFSSTKSTSNDFVGAFGLGSKSPFSYTDAFTVTSVFEGFLRQYSIFIGEDGMPRVSLMGEPQPTEDHNGVTVMVPVAENDIHGFRYDAQTAYQFFDVLPEFNINVTIPRPMLDNPEKLMMEKDSWRLTYKNAGVRVVTQGPVGYPLSGIIKHVPSNSPLRTMLESELGIVLRMPMGSLDITASREEVSWDERTIQNVIAKLEEIYNDMKSEAARAISEATSWPEACYLSRGFYNQFGEKLYRSLITSSVEFDGFSVTDSVQLDPIAEDKSILRASYLSKESQREFYFTLRDETRDKELFVNMNRPLVIVWNNEDKEWKGLRRLKLWVQDTNLKPKDANIVMLSCSREAAEKYVEEYFHIEKDNFPVFVKFSTDFPEIPAKPVIKGTRKVRDLSKPKYVIAVGPVDHATIAAIEDCVGYLVTNRGAVISPDTFSNGRGYDSTLRRLQDLGIGDFTNRIARVRRGDEERFKKDFPNVPKADVGLKAVFVEYMKNSEMDRNIYEHRNELVNSDSIMLSALPKLIAENEVLKDSIEAAYVNIVESMKTAAQTFEEGIWTRCDNLRTVANRVGFYGAISELGTVYNAEEIETLQERYPLALVRLNDLSENARANIVTEVQDYILMKMKGIYNLI